LAQSVLCTRAGGIHRPMSTALLAATTEEAPATTLANLIAVLSDLTEDENEIVGTLLHMVEQGSVRLVCA
jgi:hypothetical protein